MSIGTTLAGRVAYFRRALADLHVGVSRFRGPFPQIITGTTQWVGGVLLVSLQNPKPTKKT